MVQARSIMLQHVHTCMVNNATICTYRHGQYCYNMYVQAWYISRITRECPPDSLLITHAHYIREGLFRQGKGIAGQLGSLLSCTTLCSLSCYLVYHYTAWISFAYLPMSCDSVLRLRDTVCAWRSTAHAHRWFSVDFELTPLVMSSI